MTLCFPQLLRTLIIGQIENFLRLPLIFYLKAHNTHLFMLICYVHANINNSPVCDDGPPEPQCLLLLRYWHFVLYNYVTTTVLWQYYTVVTQKLKALSSHQTCDSTHTHTIQINSNTQLWNSSIAPEEPEHTWTGLLWSVGTSINKSWFLSSDLITHVNQHRLPTMLLILTHTQTHTVSTSSVWAVRSTHRDDITKVMEDSTQPVV